MITTIGRIALSAFISFSLRSATIEPNKTDFEIKGGIEGKNRNYITGSKERLNGATYDNLDLSLNRKYASFTHLYIESRKINNQNLTAKTPIKNTYFELGATLNSKKYNNGELMLMIGYFDDVVKISYLVNTNRQIIDSSISQKIYLNRRLYIQPLLTYYYEKDREIEKKYWMSKVSIGFRFN